MTRSLPLQCCDPLLGDWKSRRPWGKGSVQFTTPAKQYPSPLDHTCIYERLNALIYTGGVGGLKGDPDQTNQTYTRPLLAGYGGYSSGPHRGRCTRARNAPDVF